MIASSADETKRAVVAAIALAALTACRSGGVPSGETRSGLSGPVVTVEATSTGPVARGGRGEVAVTLAIHADYHVMSDQPSKAEYKATHVAVVDTPDVTFGEAVYPPPVSFRFSQNEIRTFVGNTVVRVPFRVSDGAAEGPRTVHGTVRYQACTATECLFPESVDFDARIDVAAGTAARAP